MAEIHTRMRRIASGRADRGLRAPLPAISPPFAVERSTQRWRFAAGSTFAKGEGGRAGAGAEAAAPATTRPGRAKQQQQQAAASATAADAAR